jgi:uncharacterized UPF0160 family protein
MKTIVTHSGPFHADDVFAVALILRYCEGDHEVVRSRDQSVIDSADVAVDVGGVYDEDSCRFDHHQNDYEGSKSSVGMVLDWLEVSGHIHPFVAGELRSSIIDELDDADTNGTHSAMSLLIWSMNPQWDDANPSDFDKKFARATLMADLIIERFERAANAKLKASNTLDVISQAGEVIESESDLPDMAFEVARRSETALFVIWASSETQWMVQCVPPTDDRTSQRLPFPEAVAGLRGADLEAIVGDLGSDINPASPFVHKGAFIGGAATREGALALAQFALAGKEVEL